MCARRVSATRSLATRTLATRFTSNPHHQLIHPPSVVGVFAGIYVLAVLVEASVAVLLAHVDCELARGAAALPAVVLVAQAEVALAGGRGEAAARGEFDVDESE